MNFVFQGLNDLATEIACSPGPFRNTLLSKAAQTHKLRKLRAPSKCRECDSLVVFHGAECEEVGIHKGFLALLFWEASLLQPDMTYSHFHLLLYSALGRVLYGDH